MSAAPAAAIGVGRVAHAAPDGYTLSIGHTQTHVFNASILKLDYDVVTDFAPISLIADTPIWIVTPQIAAGRRHQGLHRLAQEPERQGDDGDGRHRQPVGICRREFS